VNSLTGTLPCRVRRLAVLAGVVLGAGVLSSCGDDPNAAASDATVLEVELGRYTISPSVLVAPAGELALRVTNVDDSLVHNLVVFGKGTRQLAPGESQTLPIGEIGEGEYRMWCDVQGHAQAGQSGALRIDPAPAPAVPATTTP
jgi:nitrite reductase (NO-forming)